MHQDTIFLCPRRPRLNIPVNLHLSSFSQIHPTLCQDSWTCNSFIKLYDKSNVFSFVLNKVAKRVNPRLLPLFRTALEKFSLTFCSANNSFTTKRENLQQGQRNKTLTESSPYSTKGMFFIFLLFLSVGDFSSLLAW